MAQFDLQNETVRKLNQSLHQAEDAAIDIEVIHSDGKHNVAAGAMCHGAINIRGHVGYYCAGMNKHADITIKCVGLTQEEVCTRIIQQLAG